MEYFFNKGIEAVILFGGYRRGKPGVDVLRDGTYTWTFVGEGMYVAGSMMGWNFISVPFNGPVDKTGFLVWWDGCFYS